MEIVLPVTGRANFWRTVVAAFPALVLTGLGFAGLAILLNSLVTGLPQNPVGPFLMLFVVVTCLSVGAVLAIALADLRLPQPMITIDETGIRDARVYELTIGWDEIARVVSYRKVNGGLLLELKKPLPVRFNILRVGTLFHFWRPPAQAVYITMNWLLGPYFPVEAVYAFAVKHGIPVVEHRRIGGVTQIFQPDAGSTP